MDYLGALVKVAPALFAKYSWRGRTIEYHRVQIRRAYGTRPPTEADEDRWVQWLAEEMCPTETNRDRLAAALPQREGGAAAHRPGPGSTGGKPTDIPLTCGRLGGFLAPAPGAAVRIAPAQ